jgi:hypothetical protein
LGLRQLKQLAKASRTNPTKCTEQKTAETNQLATAIKAAAVEGIVSFTEQQETCMVTSVEISTD